MILISYLAVDANATSWIVTMNINTQLILVYFGIVSTSVRVSITLTSWKIGKARLWVLSYIYIYIHIHTQTYVRIRILGFLDLVATSSAQNHRNTFHIDRRTCYASIDRSTCPAFEDSTPRSAAHVHCTHIGHRLICHEYCRNTFFGERERDKLET